MEVVGGGGFFAFISRMGLFFSFVFGLGLKSMMISLFTLSLIFYMCAVSLY
jgi:hypothetical protein